MVSNGSGPWYNAPARPFPAKVWLEQRYPFRVSPALFACHASRSTAQQRNFPAKVWLAGRQRKITPP